MPYVMPQQIKEKPGRTARQAMQSSGLRITFCGDGSQVLLYQERRLQTCGCLPAPKVFASSILR